MEFRLFPTLEGCGLYFLGEADLQNTIPNRINNDTLVKKKKVFYLWGDTFCHIFYLFCPDFHKLKVLELSTFLSLRRKR